MRESDITKFLVSVNGLINHIRFPGGVFDEDVFIQYEFVWGPDWEVISGLTTATSQMASSGADPELIIFNMPLEVVFSSTNVSGWPQLILTVRSRTTFGGDSLLGYSVLLCPTTAHTRKYSAPLFRPRPSTKLAEWMSWLTGRHPELVDAKMLASGKDNYLLRTESYGSVDVNMSMVSKDLHRLNYDNQPVVVAGISDCT